MSETPEQMKNLGFMVGTWDLDYKFFSSSMCKEGTARGKGTFRRALGGHYLFFDYHVNVDFERISAHGIFTWDGIAGVYRFWWFESTGVNLTATGGFSDPDTLKLIWDDNEKDGSNIKTRQSFRNLPPDNILLNMECSVDGGEFEPVMEVMFTRV